MKLNLEQIKSVTFGAIKIYEENGGIYFNRFTENQSCGYYKLRQDLGDRSLATCGVRLCFITDANKINASFLRGDKFEILVNGILHKQFTELEFEYLLPTGEKEITLVLPSHTKGVLKSLELVGATKLLPKNFDTKILFLGDSITQGWQSKYESLSYAYQTASHYNANALIHGVGGMFFEENVLEKIPFTPNLVIVAYGTNDYCVYNDAKLFDLVVDKYFNKVKELFQNTTFVAITPIWRGNEEEVRGIGNLNQVRNTVSATALKYGFNVIDGTMLVPPLKDFYCEDLLHPNDLGFSLYAKNLIKELDKII